MNNSDLIRKLRYLTAAGMKDCADALKEADDNLQKAIDILKIKGKNIASEREDKAASEGKIKVLSKDDTLIVMVECNCQTDFTARSPEFDGFVTYVARKLFERIEKNEVFTVEDVEERRQELIISTKENIVVRRWWTEQAFADNAGVFRYVHNNGKIGVLLTLLAPSETVENSKEFEHLGDDLAMQIAGMNPLVISRDHLEPATVERQKDIFESQLMEMKKPPAAWAKIIDGKMNKWYSEVCLLDQESVVTSKTSIQQVIDKVNKDIKVVNFIRAVVGEEIDQKESNLSNEVA